MTNNIERGLSNDHEQEGLSTPEAIIDRVLVKMGEPGVYGPGHTVEWVRAVGIAIRANLIEIGMPSRRGE